MLLRFHWDTVQLSTMIADDLVDTDVRLITKNVTIIICTAQSKVWMG